MRTNLVPALEMAGSVLRRGAIIFVLSDFLDTTGWSRSLRRCARHHDVIAVRLRTPELHPPVGGLMRVRDTETGRQTVVDWSSPQVREAYMAKVKRWNSYVADQLRKAQVDLMDVPVPVPRDPEAVAQPILRFFRMRELRGMKR